MEWLLLLVLVLAFHPGLARFLGALAFLLLLWLAWGTSVFLVWLVVMVAVFLAFMFVPPLRRWQEIYGPRRKSGTNN